MKRAEGNAVMCMDAEKMTWPPGHLEGCNGSFEAINNELAKFCANSKTTTKPRKWEGKARC